MLEMFVKILIALSPSLTKPICTVQIVCLETGRDFSGRRLLTEWFVGDSNEKNGRRKSRETGWRGWSHDLWRFLGALYAICVESGGYRLCLYARYVNAHFASVFDRCSDSRIVYVCRVTGSNAAAHARSRSPVKGRAYPRLPARWLATERRRGCKSPGITYK